MQGGKSDDFWTCYEKKRAELFEHFDEEEIKSFTPARMMTEKRRIEMKCYTKEMCEVEVGPNG